MWTRENNIHTYPHVKTHFQSLMHLGSVKLAIIIIIINSRFNLPAASRLEEQNIDNKTPVGNNLNLVLTAQVEQT